ncbi:MAG TPA: hypothetical protein VHC90_03470 [Bryobacteraceae bacterium]|nr:hypothetical protein [Bryobacteraceae bacterium]
MTQGSISSAPLLQRCLALTGAFETSMGVPDCFAGLAGDFDGEGLSFGAAQWNLGQGTLQPLLAEMIAGHEEVAREILRGRLDDLRIMLTSPHEVQLQWAQSIQDPRRHTVLDPWKGMLRTLGRTPEFQSVQVKHAAAIHAAAKEFCRRFEVKTERALALMFDIRVQNYSISPETEAAIREDFKNLSPGDEAGRLRSIANRRAEAAAPRFIEDVRARKLTIANGQGAVHGVFWDLELHFGIGLHIAE